MSELPRKIDVDLTEAMKAREAGKTRLSVLRLVKAQAKLRQVEAGRELTDDEWLDVIAKEVRQREESRPDYVRSGRDDLVGRLDEEIRILRTYLPEALSTEELGSIVEEAVRSTGAISRRDMGKVMAAVMPKVRGRADGNQVRRLVETALDGRA